MSTTSIDMEELWAVRALFLRHQMFSQRAHRALSLTLFFLCEVPLLAQHETMTFGVKGGIPVNSSFHGGVDRISGRGGKETNYTNPIGGVTFEKRLSQTMSVEVDATYNPEKYRSYRAGLATKSFVTPPIDFESHGYTLEFSGLFKKYWDIKSSPHRFFGDIGLSWGRTTMSTWTTFPGCQINPSLQICTSDPHDSLGFVGGAGVDFRWGQFHLYPELRYTRWLDNKWSKYDPALQPNQNSVNIFIGFSYGKLSKPP